MKFSIRRDWRSLVIYGGTAAITLACVLLQRATHVDTGIASANTLLTISMITKEALRVLVNNLVFTRRVTRQFDDRFGVEGAKIGTVLNVRKPPRYVGRTGQAMVVEEAVETQVPVALDTQFGVDISFSSMDLSLSIDDFSNRFLKPALATVANKIDNSGLALAQRIANTVGAPGTTPVSFLTYLQAGVKLDNNACPMDGTRSMIITPLMQATIVDALKGLFQSAQEIAQQYVKGQMGTSGGFDWFMDQNVLTQTTGTFAGGAAALVNGVPAAGASSIVTDGWTAGDVLNIGDVVQFASVDLVNPQSRQDVGDKNDFVVTQQCTADGGGNMTIYFDPPMVPAGQFQNISALPADNAQIFIYGAHANTYSAKVSPQGLAFHPDAFTLACADLPLPRGVDMAARMNDKESGLSVRMIRAYDIRTDFYPTRLDVLFGWAVLRPELAARVAA